MKKIFTMIIALALVPAFAAAQTTIARVVEQFKKGAVEEISTSKETDTDTDGKQCVYERNIFLVAKNSGKFKQLMDVFNDEQTNAYSVNKRMAGYDGSASKIGYGKNSEKTIVFMKYSDRNYFVLYFKDPADSKRRTCYALAWYESKKDKKKRHNGYGRLCHRPRQHLAISLHSRTVWRLGFHPAVHFLLIRAGLANIPVRIRNRACDAQEHIRSHGSFGSWHEMEVAGPADHNNASHNFILLQRCRRLVHRLRHCNQPELPQLQRLRLS